MSKSDKQLKACVGGALIFSGRPDPTWQIEGVVLHKLMEIWNDLKPWTGERPHAPQLGYRGCFIRCMPEMEWFAYGGMVTLKTINRHESKKDKGRDFEKVLLDSAPEGVLPINEVYKTIIE